MHSDSLILTSSLLWIFLLDISVVAIKSLLHCLINLLDFIRTWYRIKSYLSFLKRLFLKKIYLEIY